MKLYSIYGILRVFYCHNLPVSGSRRQRQTCRHGGSLRRQRMVSCHSNLLIHPPKQGALIVQYRHRLFPMHQLLCVSYCSAENLADCLMSQTDTQNGKLSREMSDNLLTNSCIGRLARSRRKDDMGRSQFFYLLHRHLIITYYFHIRVNRCSQLINIVRKAVIIID